MGKKKIFLTLWCFSVEQRDSWLYKNKRIGELQTTRGKWQVCFGNLSELTLLTLSSSFKRYNRTNPKETRSASSWPRLTRGSLLILHSHVRTLDSRRYAVKCRSCRIWCRRRSRPRSPVVCQSHVGSLLQQPPPEDSTRGLHQGTPPEDSTRGLHQRTPPEDSTRGLHQRTPHEDSTRGLQLSSGPCRGRASTPILSPPPPPPLRPPPPPHGTKQGCSLTNKVKHISGGVMGKAQTKSTPPPSLYFSSGVNLVIRLWQHVKSRPAAASQR